MNTSGLQGATIGKRANGHIKTEPHHDNGPLSPQSPIRPGTSSSYKRSSNTTYSNSPTTPSGEWEERNEVSRSSTKRACNECRQQKLRCDVKQDPFVPCTRCQKCNVECRIDANFKRVGKRKRNAEMEEELAELKKQLAVHKGSDETNDTPSQDSSQVNALTSSRIEDHPESHDAVVSLMDMKRGIDGLKETRARKLENVLLSGDDIQILFDIFYKYYRPYQPLIDPDRPPNWYFEVCELLFWTIIAVASRHYEQDPTLLSRLSDPLTNFLWATVKKVPQTYYSVKALCLLCVWPLPIRSTSADPTLMIAGLMIQVSRQIGLHRPSHAQDFSKFKVELREEELRDRVKTWAACNAIAQRVATGYGQPALTDYDWTLAATGGSKTDSRPLGFNLPVEMNARLRIEEYVDKVTKSLYSNPHDPVGLAFEQGKSVIVSLLAKDLEELEQSFKDHSEIPEMNILYIRAAALHFRLTVFFDTPGTDLYDNNLRSLWLATISFLEQAFSLSTDAGPIIKYATNYVLQMIIAAGFALLKLLNSSFAKHIDFNYGKKIFAKTIETIHAISVTSQDLPCRLAQVLVQLWKAGDVGKKGNTSAPRFPDRSLQLKVRCRMSMSLVYDSVWRWREEFQSDGYARLEAALTNPTKPDLNSDSSSSTADSSQPPEALPISKTMDITLAPPSFGPSRGTTPIYTDAFSEWNNQVFDPLNWSLDGLVDLPFSTGMHMGEFDTNGLGI